MAVKEKISDRLLAITSQIGLLVHFKLSRYSSCPVADGKLLVHSRSGAFVVTDPNMVKALLSIEKQKKERITDETLSTISQSCQLNASKLKIFLEKKGILSQVSSSSFSIKEVVLVSDDSQIEGLVREHLEHENLAHLISTRERSSDADSDALIAVILSRYDPKKISEIYRRYNSDFFMTSYVLDRFFFMDNLYIRSHGNPCHHCNIGTLKGAEAEKKTNRSQSFFYFYSYILKNKLPLSISRTLSYSEKGALVTRWFHKIRPLVVGNELEDFNSTNLSLTSKYSFQDGVEVADTAIHWDFCDCQYEGDPK